MAKLTLPRESRVYFTAVKNDLRSAYKAAKAAPKKWAMNHYNINPVKIVYE